MFSRNIAAKKRANILDFIKTYDIYPLIWVPSLYHPAGQLCLLVISCCISNFLGWHNSNTFDRIFGDSYNATVTVSDQFKVTIMYGPLHGPTSGSCEWLWPSLRRCEARKDLGRYKSILNIRLGTPLTFRF